MASNLVPVQSPLMDPAQPPRFWTVAALKAWDSCPKKYYYQHVAQLAWPSDGRHFVFGRSVHKLLDYQANHMPLDPVLSTISPEIAHAWDQLQGHSTTHWRVIASEWGFNTLLAPGHWLVGRLDRLAWHDDTLWIIDWKTGTGVPKDPADDWQTMAYAVAAFHGRHQLGFPNLSPEQLGFRYVSVKPSEVKDVVIPLSQERLAGYQDRIQATLAAALTHERAHEDLPLGESAQILPQLMPHTNPESDAYPLPPSCPDRYCGYRRICGIEAIETQD